MNLQQHFDIRLPGWIDGFVDNWLKAPGARLDTAGQRMSLAVALSAENVRQQTGGPFGAIVVEENGSRLVGVGVNLVTRLNMSAAHAEIVALSLSQRVVESWNLGSIGAMQLVTSCEPCAMCFGAVPWSGVASVVCGARKEDAEAAGFDEGDKPEDWTATLIRRGIEVKLDVMRAEAARVLHDYAACDGAIYHPGRT
ncbi:MAG TPA: nucleoside deaminase [Xanthomonadales bacterium]|nr:nucleoside deaminase [Xanthomonadales bacterium]